MCSRFKDVCNKEVVPPTPTGGEAAAAGAPVATPSSSSKFHLGQQVDARFEGRQRWYPGTVKGVNDDGTLAIAYADGDEEERVLCKHVRPTKASTPAPKKPGSAEKGSDAQPAKPDGEPAGAAPSSSGKPESASKASRNGASAASAPRAAPPLEARRRAKPVKRQLAPDATDGRGEGRMLELMGDVDGAAPPSRSAMHAMSIEVRALSVEQRLRLPAERLQSLLEAVQPLLKLPRSAAPPTTKPKPPAKSKGAGSAAKRRRRSKGDDDDDEDDDADDDGEEDVDDEGGGDASAADVESGGRALEGALLVLNVLTTPQVPRELFVEERVEGVLQLCKHHLAMCASASGADSSGRKGSAKKRNAAAPAESTLGMLAQLLERMPAMVAAHCLSDTQLMQLSALCLTACFGDGPMALRIAGMETVLAIYSAYDQHRKSIWGELIDKRLSMPDEASREARRNYALPDGCRVQMFTALVLSLVQSGAALPPAPEPESAPAATPAPKSAPRGKGKATTPPAVEQTPDSEAPTPEAARAAHPWHAHVTSAMRGVLTKIVSQCVEKQQDAEHKALAEEFVRDTLLLFGRPEWPAAALCVKYMSALLCNVLRRKEQGKEQTAARALSLDLAGSVLTAMATQRRSHIEAPLVFPPPREADESAQPTDPGEETRCVCGVGYNGEFMLDCDQCHCWFHGSCVGVADAEEELPDEWLCDACRLSNAVSDQRQRVKRLLELPEDGAGDADDEELALGCAEPEVIKQLQLNYLQATSADPAAATAQRMMLCEWHAEAEEKKHGPMSKLYREQYGQVEAALRKQQTLGLNEERRLPLLSRVGILSAGRRMLDSSGIFGRLEPMLSHVLSALEEPQASARAKAIKALSGPVGADPAILQLAAVTVGVHRALNDPSISVREATLDLVGQYIAQRPEFVERYYEVLSRRLADTGVSVRKRVIKILRDLCLRSPGSPRAIEATCHLVSRVGDEEEVQKLIIKTFQELWFAPPAEGRADLTNDEKAERCKQLVAVMTEACRDGAPRARAEWLGELMKLMLADDRSDGRTAKEHTAIMRVGTQLVAQLIEVLLRLDEDNAIQTNPQQLSGVLYALSVFCAARPVLLLPHVELLPAYLQYEQSAPAIRYVCDMLPRLLPLLDHPPKALLEKLEKYLAALVFRVKEESIPGVIRALCSVCTVSKNRQLLGDTLARFCHFLRKRQQSQAPVAPAEAGALKRAMLCAGLLCRHFDYDASGNEMKALTCDGKHVLTGGTVNSDVFGILQPFSTQSGSEAGGDLSFVQYALKGLGHVCVQRPDLAVRCKDVLTRALREGAPVLLKQQALANLHVLLISEQERSKALAEQKAALKAAAQATGSARKGPAEANVATEANATAALSAVLQQHQVNVLASLLDGRNPAVRREGLGVVSAMMTQGVAAPFLCIPYVMALELDAGPGGCAELAKRELRKAYERHTSIFASPGTLLEGMQAGFRLQRALATTAAAAAARQPQAATSAQAAATADRQPSFVYSLLGKKERNMFLKTLLAELKPATADDDALEISSRDPVTSVALARAEWTAQLLANLPYEKEEEPLVLVHHVNRLLSLHVDGLLNGLRRDFEDADDDAPRPPPEMLQALESDSKLLLPRCQSAALLNLVLLLKRHLKGLYQLSDIRCQGFDPSDTATSRPVSRLTEGLTMNSAALSSLPPGVELAPAAVKPKGKKAKTTTATDGAAGAAPASEQGARLGVAQYLWFKRLAAEDETEFDFNMLVTGERRSSGGGASGGARKKARTPSSGGPASGGGRGSRGGRGGRGGGRGAKAATSSGGKKGKGKKRKADESSEDEPSEDDDDDFEDDK